MGEVIVITSGKGGVGKTTTVSNIGTGLAMLNKKVVLVDTDIGLRNLDIVMGLENRVIFNLVDVIEGTCKINQALIRDKRQENLYLMPAAQSRDKTAVTPEQMKLLCDDLKQEFDYVLMDCPAGIEQGFLNAVAGADIALLVVNPEVSSVRDADHVTGLLQKNGIMNDNVGLIITRYRPEMVKNGDMLSKEDVLDVMGLKLMGIVPEDENIIVSSNNGTPLVGSDCNAGRAYMNICRRIQGEDVPIMEFEKKGFFARLFGKKN
jgi:septum site-determining protein MinD